MSEIMVWMLAALAGELLLMLLALLAFSWFRNRAASRRDGKAIQALVTRIKNAKNDREAAIGRFLSEQMEMSGDALDQAKSAMLRSELVLLQRFAGIYRKRDAGAAAQFDIDLATALVPYQELRGNGGAVAGEPDEVDPSELNALRAENKRLSDELSVTMGTMSRMLNEYSTMFAGGAPGESVPIAAQAGTAAEVPERTDEVPGTTTDTDPQDEIDVLFQEGEDDPELDPAGGLDDASGPVVDEPMSPRVTAEGAQEAGAGNAAEQPGDPVESDQEVQEAAAGSDPVESEPVDEWEVGIESPDPSAIEIEQGDDLDSVSILLEEGPVEVVAFDGADEIEAEVGDDLFDSAEPETIARAEVALDITDSALDEVELLDGEDLFDAGEEPLKTQSGG